MALACLFPDASIRARERIRAHLVGGAAVRVPVLPAAPHPLAGGLCLRAQRREVDAGDAAVLHAHHAVDDDGVDIVTDAAIDQALDRIAHRPHAQAVTAAEIDDDDVGLGAGREPADVRASDRMRAAQRRRLEHLRGGGSLEVAARDLAEIGGVAHLQDHVAGIGVGAERDVHAGLAVALPVVEEAPAPCHVDRAMRDRAAVRAHDLEVVRA